MDTVPYYEIFFFFNDTATTEIYTLSLHDALPICRLRRHLLPLPLRRRRSVQRRALRPLPLRGGRLGRAARAGRQRHGDRKSTRLNSSHANISYAVFCLKKNKITPQSIRRKELTEQ